MDDVRRGRGRGARGRSAGLIGKPRVGCAPPPVVSPTTVAGQSLQRVGEILTPGDVWPLVTRRPGGPGSGSPAHRAAPELPRLAGVGVEDVVEVGRPLVEQVAAPEDQPSGAPPPLCRRSMMSGRSRRPVPWPRRWPGPRWPGRRPAHVQVADVAVNRSTCRMPKLSSRPIRRMASRLASWSFGSSGSAIRWRRGLDRRRAPRAGAGPR